MPFIMPERLAKTGPYQQVTEMVGSGPFKFVAKAFEPGHKVVYVKNTDYVPCEEPVSWASGGKVAKVDRAGMALCARCDDQGGCPGERRGRFHDHLCRLPADWKL